jgi:hypothetical protein
MWLKSEVPHIARQLISVRRQRGGDRDQQHEPAKMRADALEERF